MDTPANTPQNKVLPFEVRTPTAPAPAPTSASESPASEAGPAFTQPAALSLKLEDMARVMYEAHELLEGRTTATIPWQELPADVCQAYREICQAALWRCDPWMHAAAIGPAQDAVRKGRSFADALVIYTDSLIRQPLPKTPEASGRV
jgi:hypothetical protein